MDYQKQVLMEFSEIQVNTWFFTIVKTATIKSESLWEESKRLEKQNSLSSPPSVD